MATKDIENATVSVHNGKLIATVKGYEQSVDTDHHNALAASKLTHEWDDRKPELRAHAQEVIDGFAEHNTVVHTVNLLGTENRFIEIGTSDRRKELPETMLPQAQALQEGLGTELVTEEVELTIKGALAAWVLTNLKNSGQEGSPELVVKKRKILLPKFEEIRRNVRKTLSSGPSAHFAKICDVLATVGIFAPSVEAKIFKGK